MEAPHLNRHPLSFLITTGGADAVAAAIATGVAVATAAAAIAVAAAVNATGVAKAAAATATAAAAAAVTAGSHLTVPTVTMTTKMQRAGLISYTQVGFGRARDCRVVAAYMEECHQ